MPEVARDAIAEFNARHAAATLTDPELQAPLNASRAAAARLINAALDEIALVPNTQVGINIAASAVAQRRKGAIVILDYEFPANVYPWLALERQGFTVEMVHSEEQLLERISSGDVVAASISFVQFSSGFRANLRAIADECHRKDALFVVDAIQGVGAVPFDVRDCDADFVACGAQKWLCAPWASGFAYVRRSLVPTFALEYPGWLAYQTTHDYTQLTSYRQDFLDSARKFEVGSLGFQDFVGFQKSVELLVEQGVDNVWRHIQSLQQPLIEWAHDYDVDITSDLRPERRSGIICIRPPRADVAHAALIEAGVKCALREGSIRLSPHYYNTQQDIGRALDVLHTQLKR